MGKNITIKDVALRAGVSKGTVDRVVHNRGVVSKDSAEKVRQAIKDLNYEPNLHAALLATKVDRVIACLIPSDIEGSYWAKVDEGVRAAEETIRVMNLSAEVFSYDMNDLRSFRNACARVLESNPSAVVMAPLFLNESISFVDNLANRGIPYIYIDTKLEESRSLAYIGMPKYSSGYLCAATLTYKCRAEEVDKVAVVRVMRDKSGQSDPTASRREGFSDYISENFPDCEILNVFINPNSQEETNNTLDRFFSEHKGIKFITMFSSRIHLISDFLGRYEVEGRRVVGFDSLEANLQMLKEGKVDILISQHIEDQAINALRMMAEYLILFKRPEKRDNFMHMDILTSLNMGDY